MFPVVRVEWVDAMADNSWKTIQEIKKDEKKDSEPCVTVGFLVQKNRNFLYVAGTISSEQSIEEALVNGVMMIPRKWIKRMDEIDMSGYLE